MSKTANKMATAKVAAHNVMILAIPVILVVAGIFGTLQYQKFIDGVKADGVTEFKDLHCEQYEDEKKKVSWYECES